MTPTVEYVNFMVDGVIAADIDLTLPIGFLDEPRYVWLIGNDEPYPLNLSRYFWLLSGQSQRRFEANILAYGKN